MIMRQLFVSLRRSSLNTSFHQHKIMCNFIDAEKFILKITIIILFTFFLLKVELNEYAWFLRIVVCFELWSANRHSTILTLEYYGWSADLEVSLSLFSFVLLFKQRRFRICPIRRFVLLKTYVKNSSQCHFCRKKELILLLEKIWRVLLDIPSF